VPFLMPDDVGEDLPPINYHLYIQSPAWTAKANQARESAGYRCQLCSRQYDVPEPKGLEVHHLRYLHLGSEPPEDLVVLCNRCHELIHRTNLTIDEARTIYAKVHL